MSALTPQEPTGWLVPYTNPLHQEVAQYLAEEAHLLGEQQYDRWLSRLTEDIHYVMPVRVTTAKGAGFDRLPGMSHFDEDLYSLRKRVERFATEHAWTEDPPSRLRYHVTNVLVFTTSQPEEVRAESSVLVFRSRGDVRNAEILSAGRRDRLRRVDGELRLADREVVVDESVLRMQNLAIFL